MVDFRVSKPSVASQHNLLVDVHIFPTSTLLFHGHRECSCPIKIADRRTVPSVNEITRFMVKKRAKY